MRSPVLALVLVALFTPPVSAQRLPAPFPSLRDQPAQARQLVPSHRRPGSPVGAVVGAILGGTAGLFGGAMVGAGMEGPCNCDDPGLMGAIYGGLIGEAAGVALGAHLGDGLRGNFALDLLASAGGAMASVALASSGDGAGLIPAVALQLALVTVAELGNARSKAKEP